jgi:hypothetical protein
LSSSLHAVRTLNWTQAVVLRMAAACVAEPHSPVAMLASRK